MFLDHEKKGGRAIAEKGALDRYLGYVLGLDSCFQRREVYSFTIVYIGKGSLKNLVLSVVLATSEYLCSTQCLLQG